MYIDVLLTYIFQSQQGEKNHLTWKDSNFVVHSNLHQFAWGEPMGTEYIWRNAESLPHIYIQPSTQIPNDISENTVEVGLLTLPPKTIHL